MRRPRAAPLVLGPQARPHDFRAGALSAWRASSIAIVAANMSYGRVVLRYRCPLRLSRIAAASVAGGSASRGLIPNMAPKSTAIYADIPHSRPRMQKPSADILYDRCGIYFPELLRWF